MQNHELSSLPSQKFENLFTKNISLDSVIGLNGVLINYSKATYKVMFTERNTELKA